MKNTTIGSVLLAATFASGCTFLFGTDDFLGEDAGQQQTDSGSQRDAGTLDSGPVDSGATDAGCIMMCSDTCTDTRRDPRHCGSCDNACPEAPENATATCTEGECGFVCNAGHDLVVGTCAPRPAPRPIAPMSTSTATSKRPTFRWELAPRNDGARVEICADRACTSVITSFNASGSHGTPNTDLPQGTVFWRLYGRMGSDTGPQPSPTWQVYIGHRDAATSQSWGLTLDVDGNGYADIIQRTDEGTFNVHLGSPAGLDTTASGTLASRGAGATTAGDVNGDGYTDVAIFDPLAASGTGRVYIYFGGPDLATSAPSATLIAPTGTVRFGSLVAGAGDVNGDGYADIVIVANGGKAYLYLGADSGVLDIPRAIPSPEGLEEPLFPNSIATAGDINGDGYADIVIGSTAFETGAGRALVYAGGPTGLSTSPLVLRGERIDEYQFGTSVSCAGDVNGDGYLEIIVGAPGADDGTGAAYLFFGSPDGLNTTPQILRGPTPYSGLHSYGRTVSGVGDLSGDGYDDFLITSPSTNSGNGTVYVYLGNPTDVNDLGPVLNGTDSSWTFGNVIHHAGDINGDGFTDVVLANSSTSFDDTPRTYVFFGEAGGIESTPRVVLP